MLEEVESSLGCLPSVRDGEVRNATATTMSLLSTFGGSLDVSSIPFVAAHQKRRRNTLIWSRKTSADIFGISRTGLFAVRMVKLAN